MVTYTSRRGLLFRSGQSFIILLIFLVNTLGPLPQAQADEFRLPTPGVMVPLSPKFNPPILKGIKVHPDNPFKFDFILDKGDAMPTRGHVPENSEALSPSRLPSKEGSNSKAPQGNNQNDDQALKQESTKLIKYFLASLTIPEKDLWVNLSPYEKDRIIPQSFGLTEMGRDLLAEDYMLKQITASLIYPEGEIGKKFWKRIYEESAKRFGTTNIPVNTFNKVWIVPDKAIVYENAKAGTAYVIEAKLKVMLEQDYLALSKNSSLRGSKATEAISKRTTNNDVSALGSQIVREIIIPELTKEVNRGQNFAQLRQVYNSLILATWYKKKIKDSILAQVYEDREKIQGVKYESSVILSGAKDRNRINNDTDLIYQRYLQAFKKGAYNYIKEEPDPVTQELIPRKYFSGGVAIMGYLNKAMISTDIIPSGNSNQAQITVNLINKQENDAAMNGASIEDKLFKTFNIPIVLKDEEISRYLRGATEGKRFYIRTLDSLKDKHFIDQWKSDLEKDTPWKARWDPKGIYAFLLPRFDYISQLSIGLFSESSSGSRLEGFIGIIPSVASFKVTPIYEMAITQMEVFYRNIGSNGDIKGIPDLLFDVLIKFCANPDNNADRGISFYPITPGSKAFAEKRKLQYIGLKYVLTSHQLHEEFIQHDLGGLFNSDQAMNAGSRGLQWRRFTQPTNDDNLKGKTVNLPIEQSFLLGDLVSIPNGKFQKNLMFPGEVTKVDRWHRMGYDVTDIRCTAITYDMQGNVVGLLFTGKNPEQEPVSAYWGLKDGKWKGEKQNQAAAWKRFMQQRMDLKGSTIELKGNDQFLMGNLVSVAQGEFKLSFLLPGEIRGSERPHKMGKRVVNIRCTAITYDMQGNVVGLMFQGQHPVMGQVNAYWELKDGKWKGERQDKAAAWKRFIQPTKDENWKGKTKELTEQDQFILGNLVDVPWGRFLQTLLLPNEIEGKARVHTMGGGVTDIRCTAITYDLQGNVVGLLFTGQHPKEGQVSAYWRLQDGQWKGAKLTLIDRLDAVINQISKENPSQNQVRLLLMNIKVRGERLFGDRQIGNLLLSPDLLSKLNFYKLILKYNLVGANLWYKGKTEDDFQKRKQLIFGQGVDAWLLDNRRRGSYQEMVDAISSIKENWDKIEEFLKDKSPGYDLRVAILAYAIDHRLRLGTSSFAAFSVLLKKLLPAEKTSRFSIANLTLANFADLVTTLAAPKIQSFLEKYEFIAIPKNDRVQELGQLLNDTLGRRMGAPDVVYNALPKQLSAHVNKENYLNLDDRISGEELKRIRVTKGLFWQDVAEGTGISWMTVRMIEDHPKSGTNDQKDRIYEFYLNTETLDRNEYRMGALRYIIRDFYKGKPDLNVEIMERLKRNIRHLGLGLKRQLQLAADLNLENIRQLNEKIDEVLKKEKKIEKQSKKGNVENIETIPRLRHVRFERRLAEEQELLSEIHRNDQEALSKMVALYMWLLQEIVGSNTPTGKGQVADDRYEALMSIGVIALSEIIERFVLEGAEGDLEGYIRAQLPNELRKSEYGLRNEYFSQHSIHAPLGEDGGSRDHADPMALTEDKIIEHMESSKEREPSYDVVIDLFGKSIGLTARTAGEAITIAVWRQKKLPVGQEVLPIILRGVLNKQLEVWLDNVQVTAQNFNAQMSKPLDRVNVISIINGDKSQASALNKGGIDFSSDKMNLQVKSGSIQFHIDPAMLQQLQDAQGFTPVIINIQPLFDLKRFLLTNV